MITSLYRIELKDWVNIFVIIFSSLLSGILIVYVNAGVAIGLFASVVMYLYLKKIENIFLMWLLLSPLLSVDYFSFLSVANHPILTFDRVIIGALFLFILVEATMKRRTLQAMNRVEMIMIILFAIIIYSITFDTMDKISGARTFIDSFLFPFMIYLLAKNIISDEKYFNKFINVLLIVGIYLSLIGIFEGFTGRDLFAFREGLVERSGWLRINGPYKDDVSFGVNVSICLFIALYKFITGNNGEITNRRKVFYSLIFGLFVLAIFFNFYRGIWLALIVGLLVWFFIRKRGLNKLAFSIILLTVIIVPNFNKIRSTRFFGGRLTYIDTIQGRLDTFDETIYLFKENPIKGIGFTNFSKIQGSQYGIHGGSQHNTFLRFLSETGILGASVFMIFVLFLFYYGFKNYRLSRGHLNYEFSIIFLCILIIYSVTMIGLDIGFLDSVNKLFFAIVGVSLGKMKNLYQLERNEKYSYFIKR